MEREKEKRSVVTLLLGFMKRVSGDHVGAYATQAAYFLILSFIPCILFLTTLVRYTPLTYNVVRDAIVAFVRRIFRVSYWESWWMYINEALLLCLFLRWLLCGLRERECSR